MRNSHPQPPDRMRYYPKPITGVAATGFSNYSFLRRQSSALKSVKKSPKRGIVGAKWKGQLYIKFKTNYHNPITYCLDSRERLKTTGCTVFQRNR